MLMICGLFLKGRVLAQDEVDRLTRSLADALQSESCKKPIAIHLFPRDGYPGCRVVCSPSTSSCRPPPFAAAPANPRDHAPASHAASLRLLRRSRATPTNSTDRSRPGPIPPPTHSSGTRSRTALFVDRQGVPGREFRLPQRDPNRQGLQR